MAAQSVRIEIQLNLGIKGANQIAFNHYAAKTLLAADFHLGAELLAPIEFDGMAAGTLASSPCDGYAPLRRRKRAEFRCVDRQLMQCQAEILCRFRFERDLRAIDSDLPRTALD